MYCLLNTWGQVAFTDVEDLAKNLNATENQGNYKGKLGNLIIFIKPTGEYSIKGSIWIYALGNNSSPFSYQRLIETIQELDSLTFGTFSAAQVISAEIGINVLTKYSPLHYLMYMVSSKHKNRSNILNPKFKNNTLWARMSQAIAHYYKIYDKTFESKLMENMVRVEHCIRNMRMYLGHPLTVNEIIQPAFIKEQLNLIRSFVNELIMKPKYDPSVLDSLKPQDKWRYLAYCNSSIDNPRVLLNSMNLDTNTKSREYKKLMRVISDNKENVLKTELINAVEAEINSLIFE